MFTSSMDAAVPSKKEAAKQEKARIKAEKLHLKQAKKDEKIRLKEEKKRQADEKKAEKERLKAQKLSDAAEKKRTEKDSKQKKDDAKNGGKKNQGIDKHPCIILSCFQTRRRRACRVQIGFQM